MSPFYESPLQVSARLAAKVEREAYERGLDAGRRESQAELADLRERAELLSKSWDTEVEDANQARAERLRLEGLLMEAIEWIETHAYAPPAPLRHQSEAKRLRADLEASE